jgi:DNA-binding NarL/FixJ family response regulator
MSDKQPSDRELAILRLLADGATTDEVAAAVHLAPKTVKNNLHALTVRVYARNRTHLVSIAHREGWL